MTTKAKKKPQIKTEEPTIEAVPEQEPAPSVELASMKQKQAELLELREKMTGLGIDSLGKLDALLSPVNQRIAELGG